MLTVATWNINSVRLREGLVTRFLDEHGPDVLCLQEIKCQNDQFPGAAFRKLGYAHQAVHGQKGYHGVAVLSRRPIRDVTSTDFCAKGDCRHISVMLEADDGAPVRLHNIYLPAGGDEPDPDTNPKFRHKLDFVEELAGIGAMAGGVRSLLVGDLNIAPLEHDVWSHRQMLGVVSHTPVETEGFVRVRQAGGWHDVMRQAVPESQKLYTWWSYRAQDWALSDRGRRLDHVWAAPSLAERLAGMDVHRSARGWDRPSDHVPVVARFDL